MGDPEHVHPTAPICGATLHWCICIEPPDHQTPHVCKCTGSWSYDDAGDLQVHAWPPLTQQLIQQLTDSLDGTMFFFGDE